MLFAEIDQSLHMPIAVIVAAMITSSAVIFAAIYSKRPPKNTDGQGPTQNPKTKRWILSVETVMPTILLLFSTWRLVVILSDSSPVTRSTVFGIAVFVGVGFICAVFLLVKLVFILAVRKTWQENPELSER